jgi:glucan 1,3-beta-glucosidase
MSRPSSYHTAPVDGLSFRESAYVNNLDQDAQLFAPPMIPYGGSPMSSTPRDSYVRDSTGALLTIPEKAGQDQQLPDKTRPIWRKPIFWLIIVAIIIVVVLAVVIPVYFLVIKPKHHSVASSTSPTSTGGSAAPSGTHTPNSPSNGIVIGGDGSTVVMQDGTSFIYNNSFGGYCELFEPFFV